MLDGISAGEYVVYPFHGVGQFLGFEEQSVGDFIVRLVVITFPKHRMTLKIPFSKISEVGLRRLSSSEEMEKALETLISKTRQKRVVWSKRAQEYETKINSGDPLKIAEVIRDLFQSGLDSDQSYSEHEIYKVAVERFSRELAIVQDIDESDAIKKMETILKAA